MYLQSVSCRFGGGALDRLDMVRLRPQCCRCRLCALPPDDLKAQLGFFEGFDVRVLSKTKPVERRRCVVGVGSHIKIVDTCVVTHRSFRRSSFLEISGFSNGVSNVQDALSPDAATLACVCCVESE